MFFNWFGSVWNLQVSIKYGHSILPPTKDVLIQHIQKSACVSGHIWDRSDLPNKTDEPSSNWTCSTNSNKISPNNTPLPENWVKIAFKKCHSRLKSVAAKKISCKKRIFPFVSAKECVCFVIENWYISLCFCSLLWIIICLHCLEFQFNLFYCVYLYGEVQTCLLRSV